MQKILSSSKPGLKFARNSKISKIISQDSQNYSNNVGYVFTAVRSTISS